MCIDDSLISRQALIKAICEGYDFNYGNYPLTELLDCVKKQPAAYDVEKVVERLKECRDIMLSPIDRDCFGEECKHGDCSVCVFDKAIEIVRRGGE